MKGKKYNNTSASNAKKPQSKKRGRPKSKGLGDHIESAIKATRLNVISDAYERITGKDCGCEKRKDWLNKKGSEIMDYLFKGNSITCPSEEEKKLINSIELYKVDGVNAVKTNLTISKITLLYNKVTGLNAQAPTCKCQATIDTIYERVERLKGIMEICDA